MPSKGDEPKDGNTELMPSIRRVMKYTNGTYEEALKLPTDIFLLCSKNMYVEELMQTEEGRKYLKDCERMKVTEPDMEALNRKYGE